MRHKGHNRRRVRRFRRLKIPLNQELECSVTLRRPQWGIHFFISSTLNDKNIFALMRILKWDGLTRTSNVSWKNHAQFRMNKKCDVPLCRWYGIHSLGWLGFYLKELANWWAEMAENNFHYKYDDFCGNMRPKILSLLSDWFGYNLVEKRWK